MKLVKLSLSQNKKRFIFTLVGLMIAGTTMIFSLFYTEAIKHSISISLPLKENELHLCIDEKRYPDTPINFYKKLQENFEVVIPFVRTNQIYYGEVYDIIGTDIDGGKIYVEQSFIDYEIIERFSVTSSKPLIIIHEALYESIGDNLILINEVIFEIGGIYKIINGNDEYIHTFLVSLDDYASSIDGNIFNTSSGINRYNIDDYLIISNLKTQDAINLIVNIYQDPGVRYFVNSHEYLMKIKMNDFLVFTNIPIVFFILITIFSIFNVVVAVNLTIKERKHFYKIMTVLGMRIKHLKQMVILEITIVSVLAGLTALIVGLIGSGIVIGFSSAYSFVGAPLGTLILVLGGVIIIPVIQTIISLEFIKYRHIIN